MFSLKDPSLLAFDERRATDSNLKSIYSIAHVPGDTQMRTILDDVEPVSIRPVFKDVLRQLQRSKELDKFIFLGGSYLVSLDGTGYFSSKQIHCSSCLQKVNKKTGEVTYYHQLMGGVIIHPKRREVIPLMPEPIMKQDGETKNDCERNAAKRFLAQLKYDYPDLTFTITEDALSPNQFPCIFHREAEGVVVEVGVDHAGAVLHVQYRPTLSIQVNRAGFLKRRSFSDEHIAKQRYSEHQKHQQSYSYQRLSSDRSAILCAVGINTVC